jgi:hypothetical protein
MTPVTNVLTQYGAVGLIALIAVMVARTLWLKREQAHDAEVARLTVLIAQADERTVRAEMRADRVTEELGRLNELVRNEYVNTITRTSQALADASRDVAAARSANARRR